MDHWYYYHLVNVIKIQIDPDWPKSLIIRNVISIPRIDLFRLPKFVEGNNGGEQVEVNDGHDEAENGFERNNLSESLVRLFDHRREGVAVADHRLRVADHDQVRQKRFLDHLSFWLERYIFRTFSN